MSAFRDHGSGRSKSDFGFLAWKSVLGRNVLQFDLARKIPVFRKKPGCGGKERVHPGFFGKAGVLSDS